MPCEWMSLDVMDVSGDMHLDVVGPPPPPPPSCLHASFPLTSNTETNRHAKRQLLHAQLEGETEAHTQQEMSSTNVSTTNWFLQRHL